MLSDPVVARAADRSAATGGTWVAFTAGASDAASVTTIPAPSEMSSPGQGSDSVVSGSDTPKLDSSAARPRASPSPSATPSADPTTPTNSASVSTEPNTWPRPAPRARSRASDRVRWPTMMEKVFQITNAPVNSAIPANPRKKSVRMDSWLFSCAASLAAADAAVTAVTPAGSTAAIRSRSVAGDTPGAACTGIWSYSPLLPNSRCTSSTVKIAIDPPAMELPDP